MPTPDYDQLIANLRASGYDTDRIEPVPQHWPD
jgi:hypothetical protein